MSTFINLNFTSKTIIGFVQNNQQYLHDPKFWILDPKIVDGLDMLAKISLQVASVLKSNRSCQKVI